MPKDTSNHPHLPHKTRDYAYKPYPSHDKGPAASLDNSLAEGDPTSRNDWEDVTCSVCMETPHNAVLLRCSSHEKGCRPYMCDTSYRHSNCLDQYCKAHLAGQKACANRHENGQLGPENNMDSLRHGDSITSSPRLSRVLDTDEQGRSQMSDNEVLEDAYGRGNLEISGRSSQRASSLHGCDVLGLLCPLCRGHVQGWEVINKARDSLNRKARVCAREACSFVGSYEELRAHARRDHPAARPAEMDPARQHSWSQLERQRDFGDVLSIIQSAMPRTTVAGDYAVDEEEDYTDNIDNDFPNDEGHMLTVFLLFHVFGPVHSIIGGRSFPPFRGASRRYRRTGSSRQGLWGEILQQSLGNEGNSSGGNNNPEELATGTSHRRQRRHQHRSQG